MEKNAFGEHTIIIGLTVDKARYLRHLLAVAMCDASGTELTHIMEIYEMLSLEINQIAIEEQVYIVNHWEAGIK